MWVINSILILLFLTGYLGTLRNYKEELKNIDRKEHKLYAIYPLADWLLTKTGLYRILYKNYRVTSSLKALNATNKEEEFQKPFWCNRVSQIIVVIVLFNLLSLLGALNAGNNSVLINKRYVERPDYGESSNEVNLKVSIQETGKEKQLSESGDGSTQEVTIHVGERQYTQEQTKKLFAKAFEYIQKEVLGSNKSKELIYDNLDFCTSIPGTSIKVEWIPSDYSLIKTDGEICNEDLTNGGITTKVTAILTYYEQKAEQSMSFHIMPRQYSEQEILAQKLEQAMEEASKKTSVDKLLELPKQIEEYDLHWEATKDNSSTLLLALGAFLAILVWVWGDKELENKMKYRKQQLLMDYPELINKFTLLVNAGMTIKQAWNKIAEDYSSKYQNKRLTKHYAYEEMLTTVRELKLGVPENIAYEQYGRRAGLIPYIKFSSLISQNLKKGTRGFTELLIHEATEAFEERKEIAKRLGEEAGTKLLIPMMIMLIIVFLIIMIPAFMAFQI